MMWLWKGHYQEKWSFCKTGRKGGGGAEAISRKGSLPNSSDERFWTKMNGFSWKINYMT